MTTRRAIHDGLVKAECLDDALANNEPSTIRGGLTTTERKAYKRHESRKKAS